MKSDEEVLRAVAAALERIEARPPGWRRLLSEYVLDPLGRLLRSLLEGLGSLLPGSLAEWLPALAKAVVVLGAAILVVALARRLLAREQRRRADLAGGSGDGDRALLSAADAEADAERLRLAGDFAGALRRLYLAAVLRLHVRFGLRFDASLTPGDVLRRFQRAEGRVRLGEFVRGYERVSFGGAALDGAGYDRLRALRPEEAT